MYVMKYELTVHFSVIVLDKYGNRRFSPAKVSLGNLSGTLMCSIIMVFYWCSVVQEWCHKIRKAWITIIPKETAIILLVSQLYLLKAGSVPDPWWPFTLHGPAYFFHPSCHMQDLHQGCPTCDTQVACDQQGNIFGPAKSYTFNGTR